MIKWIIAIIAIIFIFRSCKNDLSKGIDVGQNKYNEIAQQKYVERQKTLQKGSESMAKFQNLRFLMWSPREVVFENGRIAELGQNCAYGKCRKIEYNRVHFDTEDGDYVVYRNDLMMSNVQEKKEESITTKLVDMTKKKE